MKYVKKPIVVEAMQWDGSSGGAQSIIDTFGESLRAGTGLKGNYLEVLGTPHGDIEFNPTDWVIKGVEGELYPCPDSVFQATYEAVDEVVQQPAAQLDGNTTRTKEWWAERISEEGDGTVGVGGSVEEPGAMYKRAFARAAANVDLMRQVAVLMTGADDRAEFERLNAFEEKKDFLKTASEIIDLVRAASRDSSLG